MNRKLDTHEKHNCVVKRVDDIEKSPIDDREFRGLELSNGLRVLLVSDPSTDKAASAIDVACGYMMDPWEMQGTAHFCEHMLFLGTQKYPDENDLIKFMTSNGGRPNGHTTTDHTTFNFSVNPDQLENALDRFIEIFLEPRFTESAMMREVNAIESEYQDKMKTEKWRNIYAVRPLFCETHDYGKFGLGNRESLMDGPREKGIDPREELLKFYSTWYSSNIMTCVIMGKESLDELQDLLGKVGFDRIPNKNVETMTWVNHPLGTEQLEKVAKIVPIVDENTLHIIFPVPYLYNEYKSHPYKYIEFLITRKGKGSLVSELKRLGWVTALYASQNHIARGLASFTVAFTLTEEGLKNMDTIVEVFFNYMGMIKVSGIQERIYEELRDIGNTLFLYELIDSSVETASMLATTLQEVCFEDILSCNHTLPEFRPDLIKSILDCLVPENMIYIVFSKTFAGLAGSVTEPISGAEMLVEDIPIKAMARFRRGVWNPHKKFHLPERNMDIPTKFDIKPVEDESPIPHVIYDDPWTRVWFHRPKDLKIPKLVTMISISSPAFNRSPRAKLLMYLYLRCLAKTYTTEISSDEAGVRVSNKITNTGIVWEFNGYDEKQLMIAKDKLQNMVTFHPENLDFSAILVSTLREIRNFAHSQPFMLCEEYADMLLNERFWGKEEMLAASSGYCSLGMFGTWFANSEPMGYQVKVSLELIKNRYSLFLRKYVSLVDVVNFHNEVFRAFHIEIFTCGNVTRKEAIDLATSLSESFRKANDTCRPLFHQECTPYRRRCLNYGDALIYRDYQNYHETSCVRAIWQIGVQSTQDDALVYLLAQLLKQPAFSQLRTEEQLGYIVATESQFNKGTTEIQITVQGPNDPDFVMERIEAFLESRRAEIGCMTEEEHQENVNALVTSLKVSKKHLYETARDYWKAIENRSYDFERNSKLVEVLLSASKGDLLQFFDNKLAKNGSERRLLAVFVHGSKDSKIRETEKKIGKIQNPMEEIESIERFRISMELFELATPAIDIVPIGVHPDEVDKKVEAKHI